MTILNIITYPDKRLSMPSEPIESVDEELKTLIEDMAETMFEAPGVGLAAVQVGVNRQLLVYNEKPGDEEKSYKVLINPVIEKMEGEYLSEEEGCLSVPEYRTSVKRAQKIIVKALDIDMSPIEIVAEDIQAVILQHEIDHLNGILFIDRISLLKKQMYKKKMKKLMGKK